MSDTRAVISPSRQDYWIEMLRRRQQAQEEARRRQAQISEQQAQTRRLVQQVKQLVIDCYMTLQEVPREAVAAAKLAIEKKLHQLPLRELPFHELRQIAEGIREGIYRRYARPRSSTHYARNPEVVMPKTKLLSGLYACPDCDAEYNLEQTPESEAQCDECGTELEAVDEDED